MRATSILAPFIAVALAAFGIPGAAANVGPADSYNTFVRVANPKMNFGAVVDVARAQLERMATWAPRCVPIEIVEVTAPEASDLETTDANAEVEAADALALDRTIWLVRAKGPYVSFRGLDGPRLGTSGYFLIDDGNGEVVGMSFHTER